MSLAAIALMALSADRSFLEPTVDAQATQTSARPLRARVPFGKPTNTTLKPSDDPRVITIKFREGTRIRQQGLAFAAPSALRLAPHDLELRDRFGLDDGVIATQLAAVDRLVASQRNPLLQRLFNRPEGVLDEERRRGETQSGDELADLNLYYVLARDTADVSATEVLLDQLNALDIVEIAYVEPEATPTGDINPPTPDFSFNQLYLGSAGVDATYARIGHNARGQGVKIIDVEHNWRFDHEDVPNVFLAAGTPWGPRIEHGTAVLGVLAAQDNGYGMIGIAPDATIGVASSWYRFAPDLYVSLLSRAINEAAAPLGPGDVILIELGAPGPDSGQSDTCQISTQFEYIPVEWWPAPFDAIRAATASRIVVVEAAGNGSMNLDDPRYQGRFDRSVRDSGAIMVGATDKIYHVPLCFTNYGSRVDLHSWGFDVATLGYGDLAKVNGSDRRQFYTGGFWMTSAASAIIAGVVAVTQSALVNRGLPRLFPEEMRSLLSRTGIPQLVPEQHVGPMPHLFKIIAAYELGETCIAIAPSEAPDTRSAYVPPFGQVNYCFTVGHLDAARAVKYVFDTCSGTDFDTELEVNGPQGLVGYAHGGCRAGSTQARVVVQPTVAGSYRVRVKGSLTASGDMTLRFFKLPPPIETSGE